jgi:hypothetical protein
MVQPLAGGKRGHRGPADRGKGQGILFHRYGTRLQQDKKGFRPLSNKAQQFLKLSSFGSIFFKHKHRFTNACARNRLSQSGYPKTHLYITKQAA